MDISLREWLIIGGILIVVLILIDGWRRVSANRNRLRLEIDRTLSELGESDPQSSHNPELPNGGARRRTLEADRPQQAEAAAKAESKPAPARPDPQSRREPVFNATPAVEPESFAADEARKPKTADAIQTRLSEMDPLFDDIPADVEVGRARPVRSRQPTPVRAEQPAPVQQRLDDDPELMRAVEQGELQGGALELDSPPESRAEHNDAGQTHLDGGMELDFEQPIPILFDKVPSPDAADLPDDTLAAYKRSLKQQTAEPEPRPEQPADNDMLRGLTATELPADIEETLFSGTELNLDEEAPEPAPQQQTPEQSPQQTAQQPAVADKPRPGLRTAPDPEHVLVITVVGRNRQMLPGPALDRIVTACGMEWGEMSIYHRTETDAPDAPVQFSMANAVAPGTFDPEHLEQLHTPAVSFFMSMSEPDDPMNAYECMLATAETLAKHLDGDLLDEDRSVMRPQTKEHYRERIREFEMHNRTRRVH
jgi:cell division protein ZipA